MNIFEQQNQNVTIPVFAQDVRSSGRKASKKIKFTPEEDAKLISLVKQEGTKDWIKISQLMGTRNPRQCRERWCNYINPDLRKDPWTPEEDMILQEKFTEIGPRWNKLARFFNNRSDNSIRNRWNLISRHHTKTTTHQQTESCPIQVPQISVSNPIKDLKVSFNMHRFDDSFLMESSELNIFSEERDSELWENFLFF